MWLLLLALVVKSSPTGVLEVEADGIRGRLFIGVHGPNWSFNSQPNAWMSVSAKEGVLREGERTEARGAIPLPQGCRGELRFVERLRAGRDEVEVDYTLEFTKDTPVWRLGIDFSVPIRILEGKRALILGPDAEFIFPERGGKGFGGSAFGLAIPLDKRRAFVIVADVPTPMSIEDARNWGGNSYEIRFNLIRRGRGLSGLPLRRVLRLAIVPKGREGEMVRAMKVDRTKPFATALDDGGVCLLYTSPSPRDRG